MKPKYTDDTGALHTWLGSYRNKCKRKGIAFELSEHEFRKLVESPCFYCGKDGEQITWNRSKTIKHVHNGIDRIDNDKGYVPGNVVPCCGRCNYAKNNMRLDEFRKLVVAIYQHWAVDRDKTS